MAAPVTRQDDDAQGAPLSRRAAVGVALLLASCFALCLSSIWQKTLTADEPFHFLYGERILRLDPDRFDNSKMPLSALNALPCYLGECLGGRFDEEGSGLGAVLCHRTAARTMTSLFALVLGLYCFRWARELYGTAAGLLSLTLFSFSPNLIAHSRLVTTDLFVTCLATVATYHYWRFVERGGRRNGVLSAATLGVAQLAKYSAVYLFPVFVLIAAIRRGGRLLAPLGQRRWPELRAGLGALGLRLLGFTAVVLLVIHLGFQFNHTLTRWDGYEFRSGLFQSLQQRLDFLGFVPVPLPYPYLEGLDWVKADEDGGGTNANLYLLGELRDRHDPDRAFPGYFLVAWLFKVPLGITALVLWSLVRLLRRSGRERFLATELYLLAPVLFYGIYFNFFFNTQIGFRFFLIVIPFLLVLCGRLLADEGGVGRRQRAVVGALLASVVISVLSQFPHYVSYFNELVWERKDAYKVLADSNIEWGQDRGYMKEYARRRPDSVVHPRVPMAGHLVVSVNRYVGVVRRPLYRWLRHNFEPDGLVAGSYLTFDISEEELESALGTDSDQ